MWKSPAMSLSLALLGLKRALAPIKFSSFILAVVLMGVMGLSFLMGKILREPMQRVQWKNCLMALRLFAGDTMNWPFLERLNLILAVLGLVRLVI